MSVFLRSVLSSSFGVFTSRIFGLIRDIAVAAFFGATAITDAFFVAFAIPNLFRAFFAEGALTSAFIPFLNDNIAKSKEMAQSYLTSMMVILVGIVTGIVVIISAFPSQIIYLFMPGYHSSPEVILIAGEMLRIVMPYLIFITVCGLFTGYLYIHNSYYVPYSSTALLNISMILGAYIGYEFGGNILWLCWGVLLGGMLQLSYILFFALKRGMRFSWHGIHPDVKKTFRLLLPSLAGLGINQLYFTLGRIIASFLTIGSISYLYYADRLFQLPLGVFSIAVGAVSLTEISKANTQGDLNLRNNLIDKAFITILLIIMPATFGLIYLSGDITTLIYARNKFSDLDVYNTAQALIMFSSGMIFFSYTSLLAKVFFAEKDMKTPVKGAFCGLCTYLLANAILIKPLGHSGIALASCISAFVNSLYLYSQLRNYRFDIVKNSVLIAKIAVSCALMLGVTALLEFYGVHVLLIIAFAAAVYFGTLFLFGINIKRVLR